MILIIPSKASIIQLVQHRSVPEKFRRRGYKTIDFRHHFIGTVALSNFNLFCRYQELPQAARRLSQGYHFIGGGYQCSLSMPDSPSSPVAIDERFILVLLYSRVLCNLRPVSSKRHCASHPRSSRQTAVLNCAMGVKPTNRMQLLTQFPDAGYYD